jgi:hypothetical protein
MLFATLLLMVKALMRGDIMTATPKLTPLIVQFVTDRLFTMLANTKLPLCIPATPGSSATPVTFWIDTFAPLPEPFTTISRPFPVTVESSMDTGASVCTVTAGVLGSLLTQLPLYVPPEVMVIGE